MLSINVLKCQNQILIDRLTLEDGVIHHLLKTNENNNNNSAAPVTG